METGRQLHRPATLDPGKHPKVLTRWEARWAPDSVWILGRKIPASAGNRISATQVVAHHYTTGLCRLSQIITESTHSFSSHEANCLTRQRFDGFKFRPDHLLPCLRFFVVFLDTSRQMLGYYMNLGYYRFLPHPLQFIFH